MKITVFGAGYVGLVLAGCLSKLGHEITLVEVDASKIASLKALKIPIYEPGLEKLIKIGAAREQIIFTDDPVVGTHSADAIFIAVGTPSMPDGQANLNYVKAVARTIAQHVNEPTVVVQKSTVPVGTSDRLQKLINDTLAERGLTFDVPVVSNPEFLREGRAVEDFLKPDRVVIGSEHLGAIALLKCLYGPVADGDALQIVSRRSAELAKYACNAMLAVKISFINEMSSLADQFGADILEIKKVLSSDARIGPHFIEVGPGYGGSCFPKDVSALMASAYANDIPVPLLEGCQQANENQKDKALHYLLKAYGSELKSKTIAIWGLAFKPQTDDVRESPSIVLTRQLIKAGAEVRIFDPKANNTAKELLGEPENLTYADDMESCIAGADALVVMTHWEAFSMATDETFSALKDRLVIDMRNLFSSHSSMNSLNYVALGRPTVCQVNL